MKSGRKHLLTGAQGEGLARKPVRLCHDVIRGFMHHFGTAVSKKNVRQGVIVAVVRQTVGRLGVNLLLYRGECRSFKILNHHCTEILLLALR